jgi:hypothetical protein
MEMFDDELLEMKSTSYEDGLKFNRGFKIGCKRPVARSLEEEMIAHRI